MKTLTKLVGIAGLTVLGALGTAKAVKAEDAVKKEVKEQVTYWDEESNLSMGVGSKLNEKGIAVTADIDAELTFGKEPFSPRKNIIGFSANAAAGEHFMFKVELSYLRDILERIYSIDKNLLQNDFDVEQTHLSLGLGGVLSGYHEGDQNPSFYQYFFGAGPKLSIGSDKVSSSKFYIKKQSAQAGLYFGGLAESLDGEKEYTKFAASLNLVNFSQELGFGREWGLGHKVTADVLFGSTNEIRSKHEVRLDLSASLYVTYSLPTGSEATMVLGPKLFYSTGTLPDNLGLVMVFGGRF